MLALWGVTAIVAAVLILILLHDRKGPRDDVSAYIQRVNATSTAHERDYRAVERAYRRFALAPTKPAAQEAQLRLAAARLTQARRRVERIPAPPQARELKRRLIVFFRRQEAVGHELIGVSTYVPRLNAAEKPLGPASARMRAVLKQGGKATDQAAALEAYGAALAAASAAVAKLQPPRIFRPVHAQQVTRLRRASTLIDRLASALRANDKPLLNRTVKELGAVTSPTSTVARRAILAYNDRVVGIRRAAAAVEKERQRLDKELG